jgi:hypothetical protein
MQQVFHGLIFVMTTLLHLFFSYFTFGYYLNGQLSHYSYRVLAGRSGLDSSQGKIFLLYTASNRLWGPPNVLSCEHRCRGVKLTIHFHLNSEVKKMWNYTCTPPQVFTGTTLPYPYFFARALAIDNKYESRCTNNSANRLTIRWRVYSQALDPITRHYPQFPLRSKHFCLLFS